MTPQKKNLPPPFAPTSRPATRTKNKDVRPGVPDKPKPRRTPAEMQAIREQQAFNKQEKEKKQDEAMKKAAVIEDQGPTNSAGRTLNVWLNRTFTRCLSPVFIQWLLQLKMWTMRSKRSDLLIIKIQLCVCLSDGFYKNPTHRLIFRPN